MARRIFLHRGCSSSWIEIRIGTIPTTRGHVIFLMSRSESATSHRLSDLRGGQFLYLRPSQMFGFKAGPLSNTRKHSGAQFFAVVKGPGKRIGEVLVTKFNVGAFLGRFCPN